MLPRPLCASQWIITHRDILPPSRSESPLQDANIQLDTGEAVEILIRPENSQEMFGAYPTFTESSLPQAGERIFFLRDLDSPRLARLLTEEEYRQSEWESCTEDTAAPTEAPIGDIPSGTSPICSASWSISFLPGASPFSESSYALMRTDSGVLLFRVNTANAAQDGGDPFLPRERLDRDTVNAEFTRTTDSLFEEMRMDHLVPMEGLPSCETRTLPELAPNILWLYSVPILATLLMWWLLALICRRLRMGADPHL